MPNLCVLLMTEDNCCVQAHALQCYSSTCPKQHASFCNMAKGPQTTALAQGLQPALAQGLQPALAQSYKLLFSYFLYNFSLSAKMEALVAPFSLHLGSNSSINALWLIFKNLALAAVQAMISLRLVPGPSGMCWM